MIEYDPLTCEFIFAQGAYNPPRDTRRRDSTRTTLNGARTTPAVTRTQSPQLSRGPQLQSGGGDYSYVWLTTYHEDPLFVNVTQSDVDLHWGWDHGCVNYFTSIHTATWLLNSGWYHISSTHDSLGPTCSGVIIFAASSFGNDSFCFTVHGETSCNNRIDGYPFGNARYYWHADAWGGCTDLLTAVVEYGT